MFITGRGGAGFHSPDPALTRGRGGYVSSDPRPAPVRGPPALISWTGPRVLPRIFNGNPSGVWVGRGPERGQGQGKPKKTPHPRPLSGVGREKGRGPACSGPRPPVTNSMFACLKNETAPLRLDYYKTFGIEDSSIVLVRVTQNRVVIC